MKTSILLIVCMLILVFSAGCAQNNGTPGGQTTPGVSPAGEASPGATNPAAATPDAVASPSVATDNESLTKAMGTEGTWIVILTDDLSTEQELVLEGEYANGKKDDSGKDIIQRKIALYTQDADRNITERFTLTAPKLTIKSPMASIQHGTFKGDLIVDVKDFQLVDTTVDGNVYFTSAEVKESFQMDETSKVTGKQEVQE